jgi:membrane protein involved in D-alanine export
MTPFANWTFFGLLLLYVVAPVLVLGLLGKASARWCFFVSLLALGLIFAHRDNSVLRLTGVHLPSPAGPPLTRPWTSTAAGTEFSPLYLFLLCAGYQMLVPFAYLRWKSSRTFPCAVVLSILPLTASKLMPILSPESVLGYLGISYVTFRALDVVFSIRDGVIKSLAPGQLFAFLFFLPTVSSGPIDRYRRFATDWARTRTRAEFLDDLDFAIQRVMRGFLYKFIIAALIDQHLRLPLLKTSGFWSHAGYMYVYTFYLFFDFAGYSAFAVGVSRLMGVRTPENFNLPFLARNIRDFWTRWHMSLSFWFRDHIHMRFQLAAAKGKWFKGKYTASHLGLFLTFGLMGVWHGLAAHYILYGIYHASLLSGYDWFSRWNKQTKWWPEGPGWRALNIGITFHTIALGMLLFSGRLTPPPPPATEEVWEEADFTAVSGYVWHQEKPRQVVTVDVYADDTWVARATCNEPRADLRERGYGDGAIGFRAELPAWLRDGRSHLIEIRRSSDDRPIGKPRSLIFPPAQP